MTEREIQSRFTGEWKVCGLTRIEDIREARVLGVDWFGVIGYAASPRAVDASGRSRLLDEIPGGCAVYVDVLPSLECLKEMEQAGFGRSQIHFDLEAESCRKVRELVDAFGPEWCWLAPRLSTGEDFTNEVSSLGTTFLLDGAAAGQYGGTGKRFEASLYRKIAADFADKKFILAGGLGPENIWEAVARTGATAIDVNSGVESAPGIKCPAKLRALAEKLGRYRQAEKVEGVDHE